ncbi:MAG: hypothetical protein HUJ25_04530 [Crocinitomicaceae bacterium]|nr:hypothetical protein [Crocinitomicaceae bacterium]
MNALKSIISITLIFTYLLGFGHSLTPHCEINCDGVEEKHEHDHEHHQHDHDDLAIDEHDHVSHGDHFDEGWMDYLVCLFSDIEHHGSGCHAEHIPSQENVQFNNSVDQDSDKNQTSAFAIFIEYELIGQKLATTSNRVNGPPRRFESQACLLTLPQRGPPIYSC